MQEMHKRCGQPETCACAREKAVRGDDGKRHRLLYGWSDRERHTFFPHPLYLSLTQSFVPPLSHTLLLSSPDPVSLLTQVERSVTLSLSERPVTLSLSQVERSVTLDGGSAVTALAPHVSGQVPCPAPTRRRCRLLPSSLPAPPPRRSCGHAALKGQGRLACSIEPARRPPERRERRESPERRGRRESPERRERRPPERLGPAPADRLGAGGGAPADAAAA